MSLVTDLADRIAALKPEEAKELRCYLKDKLGIEAPGGAAPLPNLVEEVKEAAPLEFNVVYEGFDPAKKLNLIKSMREILGGLSLGDAKALVEGPSKTLKEALDKESAESLKAKIEAEGGKVSLQAS